ncbi:MAG: translocation/assembly module TamB domain-containing protein, partial [Myxococcota bacterium]|nr:translocation/assembly module TamB domain-containing protein [Myxococcota bacterium]
AVGFDARLGGTTVSDVTVERAHAMVIAGGGGGLGSAMVGDVRQQGERLELVAGYFVTTLRDAVIASGGRVPLTGPLRIEAHARGVLTPALDVGVTGTLTGQRLRSGTLGIANVSGTLEGRATLAGVSGNAHIRADGIARQGLPIGSVTVDARGSSRGTITAHVQARPALANATIDVDARVTLPPGGVGATKIELAGHRVQTPRGTWTGTGGRIQIAGDRITIAGVRSASGEARVAVDAGYGLASETLELTASVDRFALAMIDPAYAGTASGKVQLRRRGVRWDGTAALTAAGVRIGPERPAFDATVDVGVAGRQVTVDAKVTTWQVGGARFVLDVEGPRDLTDVLGWQRLERSAVKSALLGLTRIDLAAAGVEAGGIVDGEILLAGAKTSGTLSVRGVSSPLGDLAGDVSFAPMDQGELGASSTLHIEDVGDATMAARIAFPQRPFDPAAWKQLGRGVLRVLTVSLEDIAFDPAKLASLGFALPYRGRADLSLAVAAGASQARVVIDVREVAGGALVAPIDAHIEGSIDGTETLGTVQVRRARPAAEAGEWPEGAPLLAKATARIPMTLDQWIATPAAARTAPLTANLELPEASVPELMTLFGRTEVRKGTISGSVTVAGTVAKPTGKGTILAKNVEVRARLPGRKIPALTSLEIKGSWDGAAGNIEITGQESNGGTLSITGRGRPDQLPSVHATINITNFDLSPLTAFLTGPAGAATGTLDTKLSVAGLHLGGKVRGRIELLNGRVPLAPQIGTLRDAHLVVHLTDAGLTGTVDGKLGSGTIKMRGTAASDFAKLEVQGTVRKISPIGDLEPILDADLTAVVRREPKLIRADVKITNASIVVPEQTGRELLDAEVPEDLYITSKRQPLAPKPRVRATRAPWLIATVELDSTTLQAKEPFVVRSRFRARKLTVTVGSLINVDGTVEIERGEVEVFGRTYRIDPGPDKIRFDGLPDPALDLRLTHDFPTLTLVASIGGRVSKPELMMSSQPGGYSEEELFAFFLGSDPGGDRTAASRDAATGVGASYVSALVGQRVKKVLPIDYFQCEPGTSAAGASCTFGRWLTANWFLAYKRREPRRDENPDHIQVQYYFGRRWLFEGGGFGNRVGGDILWRKRW